MQNLPSPATSCESVTQPSERGTRDEQESPAIHWASRDLVKKLKLKILGKKAGGGIGGAIQRDVVRLNSFEIAGRRFRNVEATIDDQPSHNDMNVGTAILKNFLITTDFADRAVWLQSR